VLEHRENCGNRSQRIRHRRKHICLNGLFHSLAEERLFPELQEAPAHNTGFAPASQHLKSRSRLFRRAIKRAIMGWPILRFAQHPNPFAEKIPAPEPRPAFPARPRSPRESFRVKSRRRKFCDNRPDVNCGECLICAPFRIAP